MSTSKQATEKKRTGSTKASGQTARNATASKKKTSGSARNTSASKKNGKGQSTEDFSSFYSEILVIGALVVAALLMLGNLGLCGEFGQVASSIFFGTFGLVQYIMPIAVVLLGGLLLANHFSTLAVKKTLLVIVLLCMLSTISQMFVDFDCSSAFTAAAYSFVNHTGGGAIGGGICAILHQFFGKAGTILIVTVISMISLMLVFEKSIWNLLKEAGIYTSEASRQRKERRQRMEEIREEEREKEEVRLEELRNTLSTKHSMADLKQKRAEERARKKAQAEARKQQEKLQAQWEQMRRDREEYAVPGEFHDIVLTEQETEKTARLKEKKMVDLGEKFGLDTSFETISVPTWFNDGKNADESQESESDNGKNPDPSQESWSNGNEFSDSEKKPEVPLSFEEEFVLPPKKTFSDSLTELTNRAMQEAEDNPLEAQQEGSGQFDAGRADQDTVAGTFRNESEESTYDTMEKSFNDMAEESGGEQSEEDADVPVHNEKLKAARPAMDESVARKMMDDMDQAVAKKEKPYVFPTMELLERGEKGDSIKQQQTLRATAQKLQQTLANFGVNVKITNVSCGPTVTRYELQPEQGVKVSKIVGLTDDIKLNLAAADIRIEAPIPGKAAVGIEVPNKHNEVVKFRDLIDNEKFKHFSSNLVFAVGKDIGGNIILSDIAKMPHLLIAGATGSGKSVCINTLIMSILYKADPNDVKFIMIDPKVVELSTYNGIPHLLIPVVTDPQKAAGALNWAVVEMQDRYKKFADYNVRNLQGYNQKVEEVWKTGQVGEDELKKLPQIVIIVDELADLMMVAPGEVENAIVRLSQLARAAGIHLVIATQRPSVNVITGLIKANVPSRIAFAVSSGVDSRTIIDMNGAEKLLGRGDMLFYPQGQQKPTRVQGAFISDEEVGKVVDFLKEQTEEDENGQNISDAVAEKIENNIRLAGQSDERDEYFAQAARFILTKEKASIGMLQRMFKIGFNRASRIMEQLADAGVVGPEEGTKPRKILMSEEQLEQYLEEYL